MNFWSSSEVESDVADAHRQARKDLESSINHKIARKEYGSGVSKWALIYIVLSEKDVKYPEVCRFQKKSKIVEFRLCVDYLAIRNGDELNHRKLLAATILRTLQLAKSMRLDDFDLEAFSADVSMVLSEVG